MFEKRDICFAEMKADDVNSVGSAIGGNFSEQAFIPNARGMLTVGEQKDFFGGNGGGRVTELFAGEKEGRGKVRAEIRGGQAIDEGLKSGFIGDRAEVENRFSRFMKSDD